jgi:uncharacterized protein (TIGR00297 family)
MGLGELLCAAVPTAAEPEDMHAPIRQIGAMVLSQSWRLLRSATLQVSGGPPECSVAGFAGSAKMDPMPSLFLFALVLAPLAALGAWKLKALTPSGAVAAAGVGFCHLAFGGWPGAGALLLFFATSTALSKLGKRKKEALGFEKSSRRDALQVLANGGVAALCACIDQPLMMLGALAAACADTWATEVGSLFGGTPRKITTLRPARPGESGAISLLGTLAALAGAGLLAALAGRSYLPVLLGGFLGSLVDSLLGATLQAQWKDSEGNFTEIKNGPPARGWSFMNNDAVNFLATLVGALLAGILS